MDRETKADIRLKLLLTFDKLKEKVKKDRHHKDPTVLDISVLRHTSGPPGAQSSRIVSSSDSSDDEEGRVKMKPVSVRDWGLKFTGKKGDMSFNTFLEQVENKRRSRGISRAIL